MELPFVLSVTTFGLVFSPFLNLVLFVNFYIVKRPFWVPPWRNKLNKFVGVFLFLQSIPHTLATIGVVEGESKIEN